MLSAASSMGAIVLAFAEIDTPFVCAVKTQFPRFGRRL